MTDVWPQLGCAPITEALLDLRVRPSAEIDLGVFAQFHEQIRDQYPTRKERIAWSLGFSFQGAPSQGSEVLHRSQKTDGMVYVSHDERQFVQARLDGFTFNRLRPYERWETFVHEGQSLWDLYARVVHPAAVTRIALRYINRLELPLPVRDLEEYLLTAPHIAPGLSQALDSYFFRLVMPVPACQAVAVVSQTTERRSPGDPATVAPVIFDVDVHRVADFDPFDPAIWDAFQELRDLKNRIFFQSITKRAEELFQ